MLQRRMSKFEDCGCSVARGILVSNRWLFTQSISEDIQDWNRVYDTSFLSVLI